MAVKLAREPASDTDAGLIEIAVQSEMEAASDATRAVVPARVQYHPGVAKFWAYVTVSGGTPTLVTSHNVTSITDAGVGQLTITIGTDFSSANWAPVVGGRLPTGTAIPRFVAFSTIAAGSILLECYRTDTNVLVDPTAWAVAGFGDQ